MLTVAQEVLDNQIYPKYSGLDSGSFERNSSFPNENVYVCACASLSRSVSFSPTGLYVQYSHSCHHACVHFWPYFKDLFHGPLESICEFAAIHEIALGLHAIGSSNRITFFPHLLFSFSGGLGQRSAQMGSNTASHNFTSRLPRCHPLASSRPLFSFLSQT